MDVVAFLMYYFDMDILDLKFDIHSAAWNNCPPDWHWDSRRNKWSGLLLWHIAEGEGVLETPDCAVKLHPGVCFLLRMTEESYVGSTVRSNPIVVPAIHFHACSEEAREWQPTFAEWPRHRLLADGGAVSRLMKRAVDAFCGNNIYHASHWLQSALLEIAAQSGEESSNHSHSYWLADMAQLTAQLRSQPQKPWSVAGMAGKMGLSTDHFIRIFTDINGCTPGRYIIDCRLKAARNMLRFSSHTISDIAAMLGYCDAFFFSRQFKRYLGQTPTDYRQSY